MMLNFIDISSWQSGMDLKAVLEQNPVGGVVVKATGGFSYVQRTCDPWVQTLIKAGKPWGFYHFLNDDKQKRGGKTEAKWFVENCLNYFGHGVPVADYEEAHITVDYLKEFVREVYALTGIKCLIYCSLSKLHEEDFTDLHNEGYPLWLAQYANNNQQIGFQDSPWQKGSVYPYEKYVMHQYSAHGRLNGYNNDLDLDLFYGTEEDWYALARSDRATTENPAPESVNVAKETASDSVKNAFNDVKEAAAQLHEAITKLDDLIK